MNRPRVVLVVCYGNICRSPYLEAVLRRSMPDVRVESAGFVGPGRAVPPFALAAGAQRGFDLSGFRSRQLRGPMAREAELIIVMDGRQAQQLARSFGVPWQRILVAGDLDPLPSATRAIQDPWQQAMGVFNSSFDRLDRCAATLVSLL